MSSELLGALMMGCLLLAIGIGIPVCFSLMGVGLIFIILIRGTAGLYLLVTAFWHQISSEVMLAIPLFILMANVLEISGIGTSLFGAAHKWFGGLKGGLAVTTVIVCTVLAAITGLGPTGVVVVGLLALPEMRKRGYNKRLSLGCIPAAGALGPIIPPSIYMIILAMMAGESVGRVFMGGVLPGLVISGLFCTYIMVRAAIQPSYAPGIPREERASWHEKFVLLQSLIPPIVLILCVLGSIYAGIATPTEAASVGTAGALIIGLLHRQLTWPKIKQVATSSLTLTCLIMWIAIGGTLFAGAFSATEVSNSIQDFVMGLSLNRFGILSVMLIIALILGMFMDGLAVIYITVPTFIPIAKALGVDMVYFVVIYAMAIIVGIVSPPFGINLFFLKGITPEEKLKDIYLGVIPFIILMVAVLFLCLSFPGLIMWLPNRMIQ